MAVSSHGQPGSLSQRWAHPKLERSTDTEGKHIKKTQVHNPPSVMTQLGRPTQLSTPSCAASTDPFTFTREWQAKLYPRSWVFISKRAEKYIAKKRTSLEREHTMMKLALSGQVPNKMLVVGARDARKLWRAAQMSSGDIKQLHDQFVERAVFFFKSLILMFQRTQGTVHTKSHYTMLSTFLPPFRLMVVVSTNLSSPEAEEDEEEEGQTERRTASTQSRKNEEGMNTARRKT